MELILVLVVVGFLVWFGFFRNKDDVREALSPAPYKVEAPEPTPLASPVVVEEVKVTAPAITAEKPVNKAKRVTKPKSEPVVKKAKAASVPPAKTTKKPKDPVAKTPKAPVKTKTPPVRKTKSVTK